MRYGYDPSRKVVEPDASHHDAGAMHDAAVVDAAPFAAAGGGNTYAAARSRHNGGVNASMCDGSVRFVENEIDQKVWQGLCTRAGSEVVK